jgi:hypothetical protein
MDIIGLIYAIVVFTGGTIGYVKAGTLLRHLPPAHAIRDVYVQVVLRR